MRVCSTVFLGFSLFLLATGPAHGQQQTYSINGVVWFDQNANGVRDAGEPLMSHVQIEEQVNGQFEPASRSQEDGSYTLSNLTPGAYTVEAVIALDNRTIAASPPRTITVTGVDQAGIDLGLVLPPTIHDARYFPQTGYRIDDDQIWSYFNARGGVAEFGYPVSRTFPFLGTWVQIFQRQMIQLGAGAHPVNLLDPGLMPITSINFSTFPAFDPSLARQAPPTYSPTYATDVVSFVRQHAPDSWNGLPVRFYQTFLHTVSLQTAYPNGGGNPALLPLLNLELWGLPTSQPADDPNNHNFVYQRFQRGIMHYDRGCNCTQGILLADAFKSVLTGRDLPADVGQQMASSPYLKLYDPTQVDAVVHVPLATSSGTIMVSRVQGRGWTDLAFAFVPVSP